jgi:hypothetical protein
MNKNLGVIYEKGRILKRVVKIVDELSKNKMADFDGEECHDEEELENLKRLVIESRGLVESDLWKEMI